MVGGERDRLLQLDDAALLDACGVLHAGHLPSHVSGAHGELLEASESVRSPSTRGANQPSPVPSALQYEYRWADGVKFKKPVEVSAPAYTALLMEWIEHLLDDERVFPVAAGIPFPSDFVDTVRKIFRRLFRVYAHIYHSHFNQVCELGEEAHLNTLFKHFIYFCHYYDLIGESGTSSNHPKLPNAFAILTCDLVPCARSAPRDRAASGAGGQNVATVQVVPEG